MMAVIAYDTATGVFTTGAFIAAVAVGDEILILHPEIAKIRLNYTSLQVLTTNYTAARGGYLDNINQAGLLQVTTARATLLDQITAARLAELDAANIPADVDGLKTSRDRQIFSMDFWSAQQEEIALTAGAGDKAMPSIVMALPAGATVVRATVMFKFRIIENTNVAVNSLSGAQSIQIKKGAGAFTNCITFVAAEFALAASIREGGDVVIGSINVAGTVTGNDTYGIQWTAGVAAAANLQFNDVQTGLRIWYSV
ncbi:MAG: hypothetical protein Q7R57_06660, partial [Dehalococcoidales bacterium]|nr:hypothetical protein [Dehalococcoidales bacterium]